MEKKTLSKNRTSSKGQKKLIDKLRDSEERYIAFIRNSTEGIWRFEVDEPIPTSHSPEDQIKLIYQRSYLAEANNSFAKMYGIDSVDKMIGTRLGDLLPQTDPKNIAYLTAFIKAGYKLSGAESHEVDAHGNKKVFLNSLMGFIEDGHLIRAWGTQIDVTEHNKITESLRRSEERLALALKASSMGMWEYDLVTGDLSWSVELKQLFGLRASDKVTFESYIKRVHPDDVNRTKTIITRAQKTGKTYSIEHRVVWPDKTVHWILGQGQAIIKNGKPVRMIGTAMNIDKRKKIDIKLKESEERFRNMADTAPVLIWVSDTENLGTYFNKPWLDFTGRRLSQELGIGWVESIHPDDKDKAASYCQECFIKRKEFRMEFRMKRADGQYRWMLDHGVPRYDSNGNFLGYIGSCMDIEDTKTAKKRKEELEVINRKLSQQRAQLVELNQSKDEFISIASHQLRTPATGVKQYVGLLLEGYMGEVPEDQEEMLIRAHESNERQISIIDDLLKIARIDSGKVVLKKRSTDLVALVKKVIGEQSGVLNDKSQKVKIKKAPEKLIVSVDPQKIRMVFENLLDNASKYSIGGKTITIEIRKKAKNAEISFIDEGVGIRKEHIPQVFEKFSRLNYTTADTVGGTGIGLYWVKKIVDLHEGEVQVKSAPNKGSTFTVILPVLTHKKT